MELEHYQDPDNKRKDEVINFIVSYNEDFKEFDISIAEQANKWLVDEETELQPKNAIKTYYEELCDELLVIVDSGDVVACRFIEYDEQNPFFRERVQDYKPGLNLTFALVDSEYRDEGLWTQMFEFVRDKILPEYPVQRLYLVTSSENIPMQKTAESNGFEQISVEKDGRAEGLDNIIYVFE